LAIFCEILFQFKLNQLEEGKRKPIKEKHIQSCWIPLNNKQHIIVRHNVTTETLLAEVFGRYSEERGRGSSLFPSKIAGRNF